MSLPRLFLLLTFLTSTSLFGAVIVTFDGPASPAPGTQPGIALYKEADFLFAPFDDSLPYRLRHHAGDLDDYPSNGTSYLQLAQADSLTISHLENRAFTPLSIDLAKYSETFASIDSEVTFTGLLPNGSPVLAVFTVSQGVTGPGGSGDFTTFTFPEAFSGIVSLQAGPILSPSTSFSLDNLELEIVPEPSVLFLALGSLTSLFARRR
ncbi:MAG: hypothetical protein Q7Q71_06525 [Verrucomicrobiota bacterium JB023]|nr:hypothetical protein [Verrucomicrobiota bacterium JB023]